MLCPGGSGCSDAEKSPIVVAGSSGRVGSGGQAYTFEMKGFGIVTRLGYGVMSGMKVGGLMKGGVVIKGGSSAAHSTMMKV